MDDGFLAAAGRMSEAEFLGRYGPSDPMAPARRHDDTDVAVLARDVDALRVGS